MQVFQLSEEEYKNILTEISELKTLIQSSPWNRQPIIDNEEFMNLMKISKRTAQFWRDNGMVTFSQIGHKIYYRMEDMEQMVLNNQNKAFKHAIGRNR